MRRRFVVLGVILIGLLALPAGWYWHTYVQSWVDTRAHTARLLEYFQNPAAHPEWQIEAGEQCAGAPFLLPTDGLVGFGYADSWNLGELHQGLDIFSPAGLGVTPVIAAYAGYLTREAGWVSTVIIRIPRDPLEPRRQIWTYYTHMASPGGVSYIDAQFPPGTSELPVAAGTRLGYQGNYSGDPANPVGIHLHFSIVRDDGEGHYLNELDIANTLDPSPYLGLDANRAADWSTPPACTRQ